MFIAPRQPLRYTPLSESPEVEIALTASGVHDIDELTREWVRPVEERIRAGGGVEEITAAVEGDAASIVVRLQRGVDAAARAASLQSELQDLSDDGSVSFQVVPAAASRVPAATIAVSGQEAGAIAAQLADRLRMLPGVRAAIVAGAPRPVVRVRLHQGDPSDPAEVTRIVARALTSRAVTESAGENNGRSMLIAATARSIGSVPVPAGASTVPLQEVAQIEHALDPPRALATENAMRVVRIDLEATTRASLLRLDSMLRRELPRWQRRDARTAVTWSEGTALRALLRRVALGAVLALALAAAVTAWVAGPGGAARLLLWWVAAPAAAMLAAAVADLPFDVTTIPAAAASVAALLPAAALRATGVRAHARTVLAATALTIVAVAVVALLAAVPLEVEMTRVPQMTLVCGSAAAAATMLVPVRRSTHRAPKQAGTVARAVLRNAASILLAAATAVSILIVYCGSALLPARRAVTTGRASLYVRIQLPRGTTLEETAKIAQRAERAISRVSGVAATSGTIAPGSAVLAVDLDEDQRGPSRAQALRHQIAAAVQLPPGVYTIDEDADTRLRDPDVFTPATDRGASFYRVVLESTDIEPLRTAFERVLVRAGRNGVREEQVTASWGAGGWRLVLEPREGTPPSVAAAAARALARRTLPPQPARIVGPRSFDVIVAPAGWPVAADDVPQRLDVMSRPLSGQGGLTADTLFTFDRERIAPAVLRRSSVFVLAVTLRMTGMAREEKRAYLDRALGTLSLPPRVALHRPPLESEIVPSEHRWSLVMALALAVAIVVAAVLASDSTLAAAAAVTLTVAGCAAVAPVLLTGELRPEQRAAFLMVAAAAAGGSAAMTVFRGLGRSRSIRSIYEWLREAMPAHLGAAAGASALLVIPAIGTAGAWRAPFLASGIALGVTVAIGPALAAGMLVLRRQRSAPLSRPAALAPTAAPAVLDVRNISKTYRNGFQALRRVSVELSPGVTALLGPNGAGKTTLMRIVVGLLEPTRGRLFFRGAPLTPEMLGEYRRHVGFLPQDFNSYSGFTATQFLEYWALELGLTDRTLRDAAIERVLAAVDLTGDARRHVRDFSGGMRRRLGIARALLTDPEVLVLDEPTTGLDLESRLQLRELLVRLGRDRVVLLSTHIASDIEAIASRILLLERGLLRFDGTQEELIARGAGHVFELTVPPEEARAIGRRMRVTRRIRTVEGVRLRVVGDGRDLPGAVPYPASVEEAYFATLDAIAAAENRPPLHRSSILPDLLGTDERV